MRFSLFPGNTRLPVFGMYAGKEENSMDNYEGRYTRQAKHVQRRKRKKTWILILLLCLVTAIAIGVTVWALFFRQPEVSVLAPDYAPQEIEQNAEDMGDSGKDKLDAPAGGGSVNMNFKDQVAIDLSDNTASLYYGNPSESTQDVLLQIVVQDTLIAQSGRIVPGNELKTLNLAEGATDILQPGGYNGKLVLSFYNPETGEKATVNTEIPVNITVLE